MNPPNQKFVEANNEDFSFIAVMKKTHQKPDGTYVDERARLNVTPENLDQCEKNEIFIKDAGTSKQGHVFGLGALHSKVLPSIEAPSNESHASDNNKKIARGGSRA
ncbi:hypothetical protein YC2023_075971 [Brassica napus]